MTPGPFSASCRPRAPWRGPPSLVASLSPGLQPSAAALAQDP